MFRVSVRTVGVGPLLEKSPRGVAAETVVMGNDVQPRDICGKLCGPKAVVTANVIRLGFVVLGAATITLGVFAHEKLLGGKGTTSLVTFN